MKINMSDIKYYSIVDCDTEGIEKAAMFVSTDKETIESVHSMYLSEVVPNHYRLCRTNDKHSFSDESIIHCPKCGRKMKQIGRPINEKKLGLYTCEKCK